MEARYFLVLGTATLAVWVSLGCARTPNLDVGRRPLVRMAELEIDPNQLESYIVALKEEIETSIRLEPGVWTLYAVSVKDHPSEIRIFETYASVAAYEAHLDTPHFKKYKSGTEGMVKALKLIETEPIFLGARK